MTITDPRAHETRLSVFRLLVQAKPDGLVQSRRESRGYTSPRFTASMAASAREAMLSLR